MGDEYLLACEIRVFTYEQGANNTFVTSTLSNTSYFFYPLIFFEFKNVCRAPYTWPHFGAISVPLEAIAFFRDRRHIEYLQIQKN